MYNDLPTWKKAQGKFAQVKGLHLELTLSTRTNITDFFFPFLCPCCKGGRQGHIKEYISETTHKIPPELDLQKAKFSGGQLLQRQAVNPLDTFSFAKITLTVRIEVKAKPLNPEQNTDWFLSALAHSTDTQISEQLVKFFAWLNSLFVCSPQHLGF